MSLPISPLQRSQQDLGGAADEMGGLYAFPAGVKPFSPGGMEKPLQLLCRCIMLRWNPGVYLAAYVFPVPFEF